MNVCVWGNCVASEIVVSCRTEQCSLWWTNNQWIWLHSVWPYLQCMPQIVCAVYISVSRRYSAVWLHSCSNIFPAKNYGCIIIWYLKPGTHMRTRCVLCVDRTANLLCTICKQFTYRSPRTKIRRFFVQTQRELGTPGVLCSPQAHRKLIYHTRSTNHIVRKFVPAFTKVIDFEVMRKLFGAGMSKIPILRCSYLLN